MTKADRAFFLAIDLLVYGSVAFFVLCLAAALVHEAMWQYRPY